MRTFLTLATAIGVALSIPSSVSAHNVPTLDTATAVDKTGGYCEWIVVNNQRPPNISDFGDSVYWRSNATSPGDGNRYLAYGLYWGSVQGIRLPCSHRLYADIRNPPTSSGANISAELQAMRTAVPGALNSISQAEAYLQSIRNFLSTINNALKSIASKGM